MVTFSTIIGGILTGLAIVVYYLIMVIGWFFAAPIALLLATWLIDQSKGTDYTGKTIELLKGFIPKKKVEKTCPICGPEATEPLPEEHNYCFACGKMLKTSH